MGDCCRSVNIISYIVRDLQFLPYGRIYCHYYILTVNTTALVSSATDIVTITITIVVIVVFYIVSSVKYWNCSNRHLFWMKN